MAAILVFADTDSLTGRFLNKANEDYSTGKIAEAFKDVNKALQLNKNGVIPDNVILMAQTIYAARLKIIKDASDYGALPDIKDRLAEYPQVANSSINSLIRQISENQEREISEKQEAKENAQHEETVRMHQEDLTARREEQDKLIQKLDSSIGTLGTGLSETAKQTKDSVRIITLAVFIIAGTLLLVFLVILFVIRLAVHSSRRQHEQLEATLKMIAAMQNSTGSNLLKLGGVTDLWGNGIKSAGSSRWGVDALPEPEQSDEEKREVQELAIKCEDLGSKIDQITRRKNNSKNVSELVYKMAVRLGVQPQKALIYFCAAMVYDAGFFGIDEKLLAADNLSDNQRMDLRKHVNLAGDYLQFVSGRYRDIFMDAAEKHHANMDGSGYPEGLSGEDIPEIARLIRVAETYVSLSSRRNYRAIADKETAIDTLKQQPDFYDQDVVAALDAIV